MTCESKGIFPHCPAMFFKINSHNINSKTALFFRRKDAAERWLKPVQQIIKLLLKA
jgi:hypothetical protein